MSGKWEQGKGGAFQKINNKGMLSSILKRKIPANVSDKMTGEITHICSLERGR